MGKASSLAEMGGGMKLIVCVLLILCLFAGLANTCEYETSSEVPESGGVPAGEDEVTPCNLEPPTNFHSWSESAISWATEKMGSMEWSNYCLRFVANVFRQQGPEPEGEWHSAWEASQNLVLCEQDPIGAPRGALIFFGQTENNQYGHVGIYLGNSELLHAYGSVRINDLDEVQTLDNGYLIGPYIGWAYPPEKWRPAPTTSGLAESYHPYANNYENTWEISAPGASEMRLHFAKLELAGNYWSSDHLYIYDKDDKRLISYNCDDDCEDEWTEWYTGDTMIIKLKTDNSSTAWGFLIDQIETRNY